MVNAVAEAAIALLDLGGRPSAVVRRIVPVRVNPVYAVLLGGPRPHVGAKVFKGLPSLANRYAATAIAIIVSRVRIVAAAENVPPCGVFWRFCRAMRFAPFPSAFGPMAPATNGFLLAQGLSENSLLLAAITSASPKYSLLAVGRSVQNDKSSEALACQVGKYRHTLFIKDIARRHKALREDSVEDRP